jgi:hypothetical protein
MNNGAEQWINASVDETVGVYDWTNPTGSRYTTQFDSTIRVYSQANDYPANVDFSGSQFAFRRRLYDLEHAPSQVPVKKRIRTEALIDVQGLDVNNLENISGLQGIGGIIRTLRDGYVAFKNLNPAAAMRALSSAYLAYKFAILATGRDVSTMRKAGPATLRRIRNPEYAKHIRRATDSVDGPAQPFFWFDNVRYSAEYVLKRNDDLESIIIDALDQIGLLYSPSNLWALLPFSFAIDWFYNLTNVFEALRYERDTQHYTLIKRIESQKYTFAGTSVLIDDVFGHGWCSPDLLRGKYYVRTIRDNWGVVDPLLVSGGSGFGWSQQLSGIALIIQRLF